MGLIAALNDINVGDTDNPDLDMANWTSIRDVVNGNIDDANLSLSGITQEYDLTKAAGIGFDINASGTLISLDIDDSGTVSTIDINKSGVLAASSYALKIYSNAVQINSELVLLHQDNSASTQEPLKILNDGSGNDIYIVDAGNSLNCIYLDKDCNTASDVYAMVLEIANAGAGDAYGLEMSVTSAGTPYAIRFDGDEIVAAAIGGAQNKKIRISIAGTDYFIPCYTA